MKNAKQLLVITLTFAILLCMSSCKIIEDIPIFSTDGVIQEEILYDQNDYRISITSLSYIDGGVDYAELEFLFENNSDTDISFHAGTIGYSCFAVNRLMLPGGYVNCDVPAGKSETDTITIYFNELQLHGIDALACIEIGFRIDRGDLEDIYTGPLEIKTSIAETYLYSDTAFRNRIKSRFTQAAYEYKLKHFSDKPLYDNAGIAILSHSIMENKDGSDLLVLEVANHSQEQISFCIGNISVNDLKIFDSTWSADPILPNHKAIIDIDLSHLLKDEYRKIYGIDQISTIGLGITVNKEKQVGTEQEILIALPGNSDSFDTTGRELSSNDNIRVVFKRVFDKKSEDFHDIYILLLVENSGNETITIDEKYDSFSVNGTYTDCGFTCTTINPHKYAMIELRLYDENLKEANITSSFDIKNYGFTIEIRDNDDTLLDEVTIRHTITE